MQSAEILKTTFELGEGMIWGGIISIPMLALASLANLEHRRETEQQSQVDATSNDVDRL